MNEIKSWDSTPTYTLTIDDKTIAVAEMPDKIKFQVQTYDKFKQDYLDLLYREEQLRCALRAKLSDIQQAIREHMTPPEETSNDTQSN